MKVFLMGQYNKFKKINCNPTLFYFCHIKPEQKMKGKNTYINVLQLQSIPEKCYPGRVEICPHPGVLQKNVDNGTWSVDTISVQLDVPGVG